MFKKKIYIYTVMRHNNMLVYEYLKKTQGIFGVLGWTHHGRDAWVFFEDKKDYSYVFIVTYRCSKRKAEKIRKVGQMLGEL